MNTNTAEEHNLQHEQQEEEQQDENSMEDDSDDDVDDTGTGMYSCTNCRDYGNCYGFECAICGDDSCCYYMGEELTEDEIGGRVWAMREDDIAWMQENTNDCKEVDTSEDENESKNWQKHHLQ